MNKVEIFIVDNIKTKVFIDEEEKNSVAILISTFFAEYFPSFVIYDQFMHAPRCDVAIPFHSISIKKVLQNRLSFTVLNVHIQ